MPEKRSPVVACLQTISKVHHSYADANEADYGNRDDNVIVIEVLIILQVSLSSIRYTLFTKWNDFCGVFVIIRNDEKN